jgi:anti-sigma B factor antagonist
VAGAGVIAATFGLDCEVVRDPVSGTGGARRLGCRVATSSLIRAARWPEHGGRMPTRQALPERLHHSGSLTGRVAEAGLRVVYEVAGDLDHASAGALARRLEALADGTVGEIHLDVSRLEFVDSVGLQVLIRLHRRLRAERRRLVLRDPAPPLSRLLELTLLDRSLIVQRGSGGA